MRIHNDCFRFNVCAQYHIVEHNNIIIIYIKNTFRVYEYEYDVLYSLRHRRLIRSPRPARVSRYNKNIFYVSDICLRAVSKNNKVINFQSL